MACSFVPNVCIGNLKQEDSTIVNLFPSLKYAVYIIYIYLN